MTKAIMMIPFSSNPTTGSKIKNPVSAEFWQTTRDFFIVILHFSSKLTIFTI